MSPLKVGDKVRTATALTASHWTQNELACRRPGAEGTIVRVMMQPCLSCDKCPEHGCYAVEHNIGCTAYYHGDELTLVTPVRRKGEPDDEPDGGRLGERVEALSGQLDALRGRVTALEQPPAPEPVDPSAAVDAADSWWCRELAGSLHVPVADGNELLHRLRARLEAYRALHRAAADTKKRDWYRIELGMALHALDQLGVSPDNPPAAVHDDSSLDPPRPVARCERCGGRPEQHLGEPTCAELLQLWQRLSNGYGVSKPGALAETALKAEEMVRLQAKELLATKDVTAEQRDELSGIHQQLLEAVDGEADATTEELLARVLRRANAMQHFIETNEPEKMRRAADGMGSLADRGGIARGIAALLNEAAAIFDDELATAVGED